MANAVKISKDDFESYLDVQSYGAWNMFAPEAVAATGLPKETYLKIMKHYDVLYNKYNDKKEKDKWVLTFTD
tara:strand:+ start:262 stop:477 length:216 start_codon:yes stop_codon:yes gene_type:complete